MRRQVHEPEAAERRSGMQAYVLLVALPGTRSNSGLRCFQPPQEKRFHLLRSDGNRKAVLARLQQIGELVRDFLARLSVDRLARPLAVLPSRSTTADQRPSLRRWIEPSPCPRRVVTVGSPSRSCAPRRVHRRHVGDDPSADRFGAKGNRPSAYDVAAGPGNESVQFGEEQRVRLDRYG